MNIDDTLNNINSLFMEFEIAKYSIIRKISESCGSIKLSTFFTDLRNFFSLRDDRIISILKRVHPKISIVSFIPQMVEFADELFLQTQKSGKIL